MPWILSPVTHPDRRGLHEVLWLLPPDPARVNEPYVAKIGRSCAELFVENASHPSYGRHYVELLLLAIRSIERLRRRSSAHWRIPADAVLEVPGLQQAIRRLAGGERRRVLDALPGLK